MKTKNTFALFLAIFAYNTLIFAQNAPQRWVVNTPRYAKSSQPRLIIDRIELTATQTIVRLVLDNRKYGQSLTEICNTFKIMAKNKKIARITGVKGTSYKKVGKVFDCAKNPTAMRVEAGKVISFDLYFTPIPKDVEMIDLIEYDGTNSCEYDFYQVDIRNKKSTVKAGEKVKPTNTPKIANKKEKTFKKNPQEVPKPLTMKPTTAPIIAFNGKLITVKKRDITLEIWDNDKEDGDIVSLKLNENWILRNKEVKKLPYKLQISLEKGENSLIMQAENLGTRGNNTAAIKIDDGVSPPQTVVLNSDMGKSEALKIVVN